MANIKIADLNSPILEDLSDNEPENIKGGSEAAQLAAAALAAAVLAAQAASSQSFQAQAVQSALSNAVRSISGSF